jgi:gliding motility-associated-like protein
MITFRKFCSLLGVIFLLAIATPQHVHAQSDDFTITQVVVNACMAYIEISVNVENVTYQWYRNDGTGNFILLNGQTFRTINNIAPGEYRVLVTNSATGEVISGEYVLNNSFDLIARDLFSGLICDDDPNSGAVLLYFDNGTSPYSYTLSDSNGNLVSSTNPPNPGETAQGETFILFENLSAGTYNFEWEDLFGCTGTKEVTIDAPVDITVTTSKVDPLCYSDTGSISFSVSGGWGANYKFKLTNSTTSSDVALSGFPSLNTSNGVYYDIGDGQNINLPNLAAGTYQLTFFEEPLNNIFLGNFGFDPTRTTSCIVNYEVVIEAPDELVILDNDAVVNNISCFEGDDGSIQITPTGGTTPYNFAWAASNGGAMPAGQGSTGTLTGLVQGDYQITVTDDNGCQYINTYTIDQPTQLTLASSSSSDVSCNAGNDGSITVEVNGGTPNYTFSINGAIISPTSVTGDLYTFFGLSADDYTVTVTDTNNCTSDLSKVDVTITEPQAITHTISGFVLSCFGDTNGVINGTISGETAPYTITNDISGTTVNVTTEGGSFSFNGLAAGNYTFTIRDANSSTNDAGCTTTASANVTQPNQISAATTITDVSCFGDASGSIDGTITGGTAPYTITNNTTAQVTNVATDGGNFNITGLIAGTYNYTIEDDNGCTIPLTHTIDQPTQLTLASSSSSDVSCNAGNDGSITVEVNGGTPNYTFSINGAIISPTSVTGDLYTFFGLSADDYTVTVTDTNNCTSDLSKIDVTITEPQAITHTISGFVLSCFGDTNGVINGTISGGTAPYTITNDISGTTVNVTTEGGSFSFNGLAAGNYTFTIRDANSSTNDAGCTTTASANVTQPNQISAATTITDVSCFGDASGSIDGTITGGTAPYTITNNTTAQVTNVATDGGNFNITGLIAGTYNYTIEDDNGCTIPLTHTIDQPNSLGLSSNISTFDSGTGSTINISCNGNSDGYINITPVGGTAPFTCQWTASNGGNISAGNSTNQNQNGLVAGEYEVVVTDSKNCTFTESFSLIEPRILSGGAAVTQDNECYDGTLGAIQATIDGTGSVDGINYSYVISGANIPAGYNSSISSTQLTQEFNNLPAGTFTVTVTDENNCNFTSATQTISQPSSPMTASETISNFNGFSVSCFGSSNAALILSVSGGTPSIDSSGNPYYTYQWTSPSGSNIPTGMENTSNLSGIGAGTYSVVITDGTGSCNLTQTYTITQPNDIVLTGTTSNYNGFEISAFGLDDGSINLTVAGGIDTQAYTYSWSASNGGAVPTGQGAVEDPSQLTAGTYTVVVTDANGCTETLSFTLEAPDELLVSENINAHQNVDCFGDSTGIIQIDITQGSVGPYDYTLNLAGAVVETTNTTALNYRFENLVAGNYNVTVVDANGSSVTVNNIIVSQPTSGLAFASETVSNANGFGISCFGADDGTIDLVISGGTPPYNYNWTATNGTDLSTINSPNLNALAPGDYTAVITDGTGSCNLTQTYTITQPNDIVLTGTTSNYNGFEISAFGLDDGSINLTVAGGIDTQAYTYSWSASNGGAVPTGQGAVEDPSQLTAGTYTVVVTDANGCTETLSFTLEAPDELLVSENINAHQNVDCFGDSTGIIQIDITQGSVGPYDYTLNLAGAVVETTNTTALNYRFENLVAGNYNVTVVDANGSSVTVNNIIVSQPTSAFTAGINTSSYTGPNGTFELSCFGSSEGVIDISFSGGIPFDQGLPTAYYNYILTNSLGTIVTTGQGTKINETNLLADTYILNATDETGNCAINEVIVLSEPDPLIISTDLFQDISCFQADNGAIDVTVSGGLGNYIYNWTKGGSPFATTDDLNALEAGQYVLEVEDTGTNACSVSETYVINEPLALQVSLDSKTDILCNGDSTGAINISVSGGTTFTSVAADYQFNWVHESGATYITEDLLNIPAGTYDLTVTDANGCSETLQVVLTEPTALIFNPTTTDISCSGYDDGSITINPTGGVLPYVLTWSDLGNGTTRTNLSPGTYTATIVDGNNCTYIENITIVDAPIFAINGTKTDISCFGANDGSIDLNITGGVAPLVLSWNDDPIAGLQRNNLGPGVYDVTITGADGCVQAETYVINEPIGLQVSGVTTDAFDCTDPNSGAIDITVAGGTLPLQFLWNNGATTEDLTAIPAGNYAVTVTDANSCQITENFTIIRQTPLSADVVNSIDSNCITKDVVQVNELFITGGFPPHTISWSYGNVDTSDPTIMRTSVNGNAVATITDNIGCTTSVIVPVNLLYLGDADFNMDSSFFTDFNIWAINDPISFTNTSTGDPQGFNWDFGDGNTSTDENPIHSYVSEGTYQITLTVDYAYGCSYTVAYTIIVGLGYEIEMPNAFTPNGDGVNDTFRPVYLGMKEVKLEIYDTWGGLLYMESSTTNTFVGWDGTVDGKPIENGNYIYQLTATARNDLEIQKTGPFTLIK